MIVPRCITLNVFIIYHFGRRPLTLSHETYETRTFEKIHVSAHLWVFFSITDLFLTTLKIISTETALCVPWGQSYAIIYTFHQHILEIGFSLTYFEN